MKKSILNVEYYTWGNNCDGWHLLKSDSLSVIQERMPTGTTEQLHYHEKAQQLFYILSGTATFEINGQAETVSISESVHIPAKILHRISNNHADDLNFLLISEPKAQGDRIEIVDYSEDLKESVKILNYEWLEKYFRIESNDVIQLSNPEKEILHKGGFIYCAKWNKKVVGTVSLLKLSNDVFELGKMAVTKEAQGHYIGNALMEHCFHIAKQKGIKKLILYSNTKLEAAIHLYKKYGFTEMKLESGRYERANIKMEKVL